MNHGSPVEPPSISLCTQGDEPRISRSWKRGETEWQPLRFKLNSNVLQENIYCTASLQSVLGGIKKGDSSGFLCTLADYAIRSNPIRPNLSHKERRQFLYNFNSSRTGILMRRSVQLLSVGIHLRSTWTEHLKLNKSQNAFWGRLWWIRHVILFCVELRPSRCQVHPMIRALWKQKESILSAHRTLSVIGFLSCGVIF